MRSPRAHDPDESVPLARHDLPPALPAGRLHERGDRRPRARFRRRPRAAARRLRDDASPPRASPRWCSTTATSARAPASRASSSSNRRQLEDWRAAIDCARARDGRRPRAARAVGHVDLGRPRRRARRRGRADRRRRSPRCRSSTAWRSSSACRSGRAPRADGRGAQGSRAESLFGRPPHMINPAAASPARSRSSPAPTRSAGCTGSRRSTARGATRSCARFTLTTALYRPGAARRARCKCPLLVCIADGDRLIPIKPALKMAMKAPHGELRRYPVGHFSMYAGRRHRPRRAATRRSSCTATS